MFLVGWDYYKAIIITGTAAGEQTNYPLRLDITHITGKMKSDFADLRFTASDGITELYFWIEDTSTVVDTSAIVWVKIPTIPASPGTVTIYMYYGNDGASDGSSGADTFGVFDHFDDESLDAAIWSAAGTVVETGTVVTVSIAGTSISRLLSDD